MKYEIFSNGTPPFKIHSIGFSFDPTTTRFGPGQRDSYIIHYITKGKGYYNGNSVTMGQGFLIYPNQHQEYFPDKNDPWEFLWIISYDKNMEEIFKQYNADTDTLTFNYNSVSVANNIAKEIKLQNNKIVNPSEIMELYLHIFNSHTYEKAMTGEKSNAETYLDFCVNYIKSHIYESVSVAKLTELLGVSQPYLYKIFSQKFNMSVKKYITLCKIEVAKNLLLKTNMSITEIANSVGYSDSLAFSKMFSSYEGISPGKYRINGS
ncbi:MAG: AraC family transcriptional regulator [Ruminococcaceae bacterium]|nr:AraC family transcriptional regulator [Oscillospiraceae bacterium]